MKLRFTLTNIEPYKQEFLEADFYYLKADLKFELIKEIDKFKKDRTFSMRIISFIRKHSKFADISIEDLLTKMEVLKNYIPANYKIEHTPNKSVINFEISDAYFQIVQQVRGKNPFMRVGYSKDQLIKKITGALKKTYTEDVKLEELE